MIDKFEVRKKNKRMLGENVLCELKGVVNDVV